MARIVASGLTRPGNLPGLLKEIRACRICQGRIPEPRPVPRAAATARILVVGQAPGARVHASGIPWDDPSGRRLRAWMGVSDEVFYDESLIAIMPMGLCYPGKGRSGDLPPRPECAPAWHERVLALLPHIECTLLIGQYAHHYYLPGPRRSVAGRVRRWREQAPRCFVLPHPSPRNQLWLRKNPVFEAETAPAMRKTLRRILQGARRRENDA